MASPEGPASTQFFLTNTFSIKKKKGLEGGRGLTNWERVHPAAAVGRQLHGHPGWCEGVDERPLGGVTSWTDVQGGLGASHREPARSARVPLRVHHLVQQL